MAHAQTADSKADTSLSTVVVTASGTAVDIKEAPASISVITREDIERKPVTSIGELLSTIPGVTGGLSGTGAQSKIKLRGLPEKYTLILVDGKRQGNSAGINYRDDLGSQDLDWISPEMIERIEVVRGPMSSLYGSDAMGGVINIITRKEGKQWMGSVSADYTLQQESDFGDVKNGRFYLSGPIATDLLGLSLRGSKQRRDAADIRVPNAAGAQVPASMGANPVRADVENFGARLAFTPNRFHTVILDADAGRQTYDNSRGQLGTQSVQGGYGPEQKYKRDQWTLSHTGRFGFGTLDSSYMVNKTETLGRTIPPGTPGAVAGSARTLEVESQVFDTKLVLPLGKHMATIGAQWWKADMTDGVAPKKFEFTQRALFLEDEWQVLDSVALTVGARYDDHSIFGGQTSPRAYAVWNANPGWTIKGGVSKGYKTPRVEQLSPGINGFGGQGTIPLVGSPNLKPETSTTTEIGAYFDNLAGWTASGTLFNNAFKDKITSGTGLLNCDYRPSPNRPGCVSFGNWPNVDAFGQSINVDEAVTRGVELNTRFPLGKTLSASANYTYTESEQKSGSNAGQPLSDTPKHAVNARLAWDISPQWNGWLRGEYRSDRFRDPGTSAATRAAKAALGDYKGYAMLHVGSSYQLNKRVTLNAAVYNLLNKDFIDYQPYRAPALTYANRYVNSMDGRRLWLSASVDF